ncbi:MAG: hypothetical protein CL921_00770 [Deltaproteobacteria bacterium]|nr:hypothetical protein [Deltaproteobacteria bacterium]
MGQVILLSCEEDGLLGCRECIEFYESCCQLANGNRIQLVKELTDLDSPESVSNKLQPRLLKK